MYQSASLGTITFPVLSAHAVVGGMECVRNFLKWHHFEGRSSKAKAAGGSMNPASESSNPAGILNPVSIHMVLASQSRLLTLLAVTGCGLWAVVIPLIPHLLLHQFGPWRIPVGSTTPRKAKGEPTHALART